MKAEHIRPGPQMSDTYRGILSAIGIAKGTVSVISG